MLQMATMENQLRQARQVVGIRVAQFGGRDVVDLLKRIGQACRRKEFHRRPIGPLGHLLALKDPRYFVVANASMHAEHFIACGYGRIQIALVTVALW